ncbi:hypothetical protein ADK55_05035, partial [Streptomyces sp. WM4235]|uniref:hypothetical protein n=1 Tax=Streptomyces sp. WM4235 TaxID=1415551 RepID=UPI0006C52D0F
LAGCTTENGTDAGAGWDGKGWDPGPPAATQPAKPAKSVLYLDRMSAALPQGIHFPQGMEHRGGQAWDLSNPAICQSEGWGDEACADAVALGASAAEDKSQKLVVRLISFPNSSTATGHFRTWSSEGDQPVGPMDGYVFYPLSPVGDWERAGLAIRLGAVIANVEYSWRPGEKVVNRLLEAGNMVANRILQAQSGKNPTASMR